jgi:hypothetical protein
MLASIDAILIVNDAVRMASTANRNHSNSRGVCASETKE